MDFSDATAGSASKFVGRESDRAALCEMGGGCDREGGLAGVLDPVGYVGLELLAQEGEEGVFLRAAGEVGRGVDDDLLEELGVFVGDFLDGADGVLDYCG